ncbi:MAG: hypothetical protein Q4G43_05890 [Mobilicoccus sp.]|nr:hypothetical protein [Mobilicoccus sp.]
MTIRRGAAVSAAVALALAPVFSGHTAHGQSSVDTGGMILRADCLDPTVPLTREEQRLSARLPDPADPSRLARRTFAQQMIHGGGFGDVAPRVVEQLCSHTSAAGMTSAAEKVGRALWRAAVDRVQSTGAVHGDLPRGDDRPLYWTRLQVTAAVRQWTPPVPLTHAEREEIIETFERASRGMSDIDYPEGEDVARVLVSGFDPFTLDGGDVGTATGAAGNNIRHGNPSGATALAIDGTTHVGPDGRQQIIHAYVLPVNYTEFDLGWIEDTVGPHMRSGPAALTASFTISQGSEGRFDLEVWNGRYHGVSAGNDGSHPCPPLDGIPQIAVNNPGCNTTPPARWGNPRAFDLHDPPQWTQASFPFEHMIDAPTGAGLVAPPGAAWEDGEGFPVVRNTEFTAFTSCDSPERVTVNAAPEGSIDPAQPGTPPSEGSCAYAGGGGTYLSNESGYRNTLLRDRLGRDIPAGHIHTPVMQHWEPGNDYAVSDATFDAWRTAIVGQTIALVVTGAVSGS